MPLPKAGPVPGAVGLMEAVSPAECMDVNCRRCLTLLHQCYIASDTTYGDTIGGFDISITSKS